MMNFINAARPKVGMVLTFKAEACTCLVGIPGHIIHVWPRFRSGDYLVTLEYAQPIWFGKQFVEHMDAFLSELELVHERANWSGRRSLAH